MNALLFKAFQALGPGAGARDIGLVADTLRASGDRPTLRVLEAAENDRKAWEALVALAEEAGSSGFIALDLLTAATGGELLRA